MLYIFLAVAMSASMAGIFKVSESRNLNRNVITAINYFAAICVSLIMIAQSNLQIHLGPTALKAFISELPLILSNGQQFSIQAVSIFAMLIGVITGVGYFIGIIAFQISVRNYGAGLSGMFNRAGIIIPIFFSIFLWQEIPTSWQWLGMLMAMAGVILVNLNATSGKKFEIHKALLVLFLTGGLSSLASKAFQVYAPITYRSVFLGFIFSSAFVISTIYAIRTHKSWGKTEVVTGIGVGICNQLAATFLLLALSTLPGPVVYPLNAAGAIVASNFVGMAFFKERLKRNEWIAVGLTVVAVILLS